MCEPNLEARRKYLMKKRFKLSQNKQRIKKRWLQRIVQMKDAGKMLTACAT